MTEATAECRQPIHFVISAPRSGSTWLSKALGEHPDVFATENRFFGDYVAILPDAQGKPLPRITLDKYARAISQHYNFQALGWKRNEFIEAFQRHYLDFFVDFSLSQSQKRLVVDKVTPYDRTAQLVVDGIRHFFPASKIIWLMRDGRDVATSGVFDWLTKDAVGKPRHDFYVLEKRDQPLQRFFDDEAICRWAELWVDTNSVMKRDQNIAASVRYEDMLVNLDSVLRRVFESLRISSEEAIVDQCVSQASFATMSGREDGKESPLAKARKGVSGDWRNFFTKPDGRLFDEIAGEQLLEFGYESDRDWVETLPERLDSSA